MAVIRHNARVVLSCERVILNFLRRMAGIATTTRQYVDAVEGHTREFWIRGRPRRGCG